MDRGLWRRGSTAAGEIYASTTTIRDRADQRESVEGRAQLRSEARRERAEASLRRARPTRRTWAGRRARRRRARQRYSQAAVLRQLLQAQQPRLLLRRRGSGNRRRRRSRHGGLTQRGRLREMVVSRRRAADGRIEAEAKRARLISDA